MTFLPSVLAAPALLLLTLWWQMLADCLCFAVLPKQQSEVRVHERKLGARGCWPWCSVTASSIFLHFVGFVLHNFIWRKWENWPSSWQSLNLTKSSDDLSLTVWPSAFQLFHVAYILIKFANSPRPDLWVLERSVDNGRTFTPWQYFAREFIIWPTSPCSFSEKL